MLRRASVLLGSLIVVAPAIGQTQASPATLQISGDIPQAMTLTAADLKAMPRTRVEQDDHGQTRVHDGVLISAVLERAGAPVGPGMKGAALTTVVVAHATDGYRVAFSLGELDAALSKHDIIVADTTDGAPLVPPQGPLRLVVPRDSRGARSVRMLTRLHVVQLTR